MADAEIEAAQPAPAPEGVEEEEDEVFLDTTMFDEDDEWLEGALAAPEDEDDDPYYFVQARRTGGFPSLKLVMAHTAGTRHQGTQGISMYADHIRIYFNVSQIP